MKFPRPQKAGFVLPVMVLLVAAVASAIFFVAKDLRFPSQLRAIPVGIPGSLSVVLEGFNSSNNAWERVCCNGATCDRTPTPNPDNCIYVGSQGDVDYRIIVQDSGSAPDPNGIILTEEKVGGPSVEYPVAFTSCDATSCQLLGTFSDIASDQGVWNFFLDQAGNQSNQVYFRVVADADPAWCALGTSLRCDPPNATVVRNTDQRFNASGGQTPLQYVWSVTPSTNCSWRTQELYDSALFVRCTTDGPRTVQLNRGAEQTSCSLNVSGGGALSCVADAAFSTQNPGYTTINEDAKYLVSGGSGGGFTLTYAGDRPADCGPSNGSGGSFYTRCSSAGDRTITVTESSSGFTSTCPLSVSDLTCSPETVRVPLCSSVGTFTATGGPAAPYEWWVGGLGLDPNCAPQAASGQNTFTTRCEPGGHAIKLRQGSYVDRCEFYVESPFACSPLSAETFINNRVSFYGYGIDPSQSWAYTWNISGPQSNRCAFSSTSGPFTEVSCETAGERTIELRDSRPPPLGIPGTATCTVKVNDPPPASLPLYASPETASGWSGRTFVFTASGGSGGSYGWNVTENPGTSCTSTVSGPNDSELSVTCSAPGSGAGSIDAVIEVTRGTETASSNIDVQGVLLSGLACTPIVADTLTGENVAFLATGGSGGPYDWNIQSAGGSAADCTSTTSGPNRSRLDVACSTGGDRNIELRRGSGTVLCRLDVASKPLPLGISPTAATALPNYQTLFEAIETRGGPFIWNITGDNPGDCSSNANPFSPEMQAACTSSGNRTVEVTDNGGVPPPRTTTGSLGVQACAAAGGYRCFFGFCQACSNYNPANGKCNTNWTISGQNNCQATPPPQGPGRRCNILIEER